MLLLGVVITFIAASSHHTSGSVANAFSAATAGSTTNPVDRLTSYDIAANIANLVDLPEAPVINGQVVAEKVQARYLSSGTVGDLATKPQIVNTVFKSNKDIKAYVVQSGDTVGSLAARFGVSSSSIKWSNNLSGDNLLAGKVLQIPPVDGIVYTVKAGDTPQSLAQAYASNENLIVTYNDAELKGLSVGEQIILPGATMPTPTYGGYGFLGSFVRVAGNYNMYQQWNCTWWVAYRWAQVGHPIMPLLYNAYQWYGAAQQAGLPVGHQPKAYAAAVTSFVGFGHVVFVEGVNGDGSVNISEMNVSGANTWRPVDPTITHRTVSAAEAAGWYYIYPQ